MAIIAFGFLVLMLFVYYAQGLAFQVWPDSGSYLVQAQGVSGQVPYGRIGDRNVGYPAFVALALATPAPALVLVLAQAALTALSFASVYISLTRLALPRLLPDAAGNRRARAAVLLGVAAATLYSVVHVQLAALLTETLFTALVLAGVLATVWFALPGRVMRWPWLEACVVAALVALPLLVKPHWQLAAPFLGLVIGVLLWRAARDWIAPGLPRIGLGLLAFALPLLIMALVVLPDRLLASRHGAREAALFGPRTAFCNHVHLVHATLRRHPTLRLDDDLVFAADLQRHMTRLLASHSTGWRLLGFNGDLCSYDRDVLALLDRRFPAPEAQRRFLLGSLASAAITDPLPYGRKVLAQMGHGFLTAFGRFALHARVGSEVYRAVEEAARLPPSFTAGVRLAPEVGPLGSKAVLDGTLGGRVVQGLLAVLFYGATAALAVLAAASLVLPWLRWRTWGPEVRGNFLALVALPLGALLGHHVLIALVHSFDVWRYGFNMFYVNLFFIGTAAMFWFADWRRGWTGRSTASG